jgi:branched-chain amino acid transport system ATP-binding protein
MSALAIDTAPLVRIDDVHTYYGKSHILHGVSLNVAPGEVVGLLGRNGVGKSTTLKTIMGLVRPSHGTVLFDGAPITGLPPHKLARLGIGYVPEDRRIFPLLTVMENLRTGLDRDGVTEERRQKLLDKAFAYFPVLAERRTQAGGTLSGGEQQMLAIARGLLSRPKLLVVDELSLGLAPKVLDLLFPVLVDLNREGLSILLVEQMASYALQVTHRTYVMENGRILMQGRSAALANDPRVLDAYLGRHTVS